MAAQRISTERRGSGKSLQEAMVKDFLTSRKYREIPRRTISTIVEGPKEKEFCGESLLGSRKADVILRLNDTRLLPIDCKVSNSALNSVKRINIDAAAKAVDWLKAFGTNQVVPTAVISGVSKVSNLLQAQGAGLTLFWAHDLKKLGKFISSIERDPARQKLRYAVGFDFTDDAFFEIDRFRRKEGRQIRPFTVREILEEAVSTK